MPQDSGKYSGANIGNVIEKGATAKINRLIIAVPIDAALADKRKRTNGKTGFALDTQEPTITDEDIKEFDDTLNITAADIENDGTLLKTGQPLQATKTGIKSESNALSTQMPSKNASATTTASSGINGSGNEQPPQIVTTTTASSGINGSGIEQQPKIVTTTKASSSKTNPKIEPYDNILKLVDDASNKSHEEHFNVKSEDQDLFNKPTDLEDSLKLDRTPPMLYPMTPKEQLIAGGLRKSSTEYPTMDDVISDWDSLAAVPANASVPAAGGTSTHQLFNSGPSRLAFKIKSSNNAQYRLKPVFGFIEPGASVPLEITRLAGPPKEDKMVVQFAEVAADATDAQAPFKAGPAAAKVIIPVSAT